MSSYTSYLAIYALDLKLASYIVTKAMMEMLHKEEYR